MKRQYLSHPIVTCLFSECSRENPRSSKSARGRSGENNDRPPSAMNRYGCSMKKDTRRYYESPSIYIYASILLLIYRCCGTSISHGNGRATRRSPCCEYLISRFSFSLFACPLSLPGLGKYSRLYRYRCGALFLRHAARRGYTREKTMQLRRRESAARRLLVLLPSLMRNARNNRGGAACATIDSLFLHLLVAAPISTASRADEEEKAREALPVRLNGKILSRYLS